jgi:hypothetical protein
MEAIATQQQHKQALRPADVSHAVACARANDAYRGVDVGSGTLSAVALTQNTSTEALVYTQPQRDAPSAQLTPPTLVSHTVCTHWINEV